LPKNLASLPDWELVLSSAARLQSILPGAVLVGGTAAAIHVAHRFSRDADHVLPDLRSRFENVLEQLESVAGWETARVQRPVQILGSLDGIETGIRQLIRDEPLETIVIQHNNQQITLPTEAEILRIKGVLILRRNATRDYIDFAALADHMGSQAVATALQSFDRLYRQTTGESPLQQLQIQLANAMPYDLEETELSEYKNLDARWHHWTVVQAACLHTAIGIFNSASEFDAGTPEHEADANHPAP
jgi:Nucleotidyl transferase AbiEii toxin, Type IV TA system